MTEIIKNKLFLGNLNDANNPNFLQEKGITTILCVAYDLVIQSHKSTIYKKINTYYFDIYDNPQFDISKYFDDLSDIIEREKVVLVHCLAGVSRSPTIVIAYLMKYHKSSLENAYYFVKSKRRMINPNKGFMEQLIYQEKILTGKNTMTLNDDYDDNRLINDKCCIT